MPRDIDERKKRKALRKLRKAAALAEQGLGPELSDWEKQFLEEVEQRIETYGSAFADPEKGGADEPLSSLQAVKLREIDRKARGKGRAGFKSRKPMGAGNGPRVRDINETPDDAPAPHENAPLKRPEPPRLVSASELGDEKPVKTPPQAKGTRPALRVIKGSQDDS